MVQVNLKKKGNIQILKSKLHGYIKSNRTLNLLPIKEIQFSIPEKNVYKINKIISFNIIKNEKEKEKYKIFKPEISFAILCKSKKILVILKKV